jgi:hypothetical protein
VLEDDHSGVGRDYRDRPRGQVRDELLMRCRAELAHSRDGAATMSARGERLHQ